MLFCLASGFMPRGARRSPAFAAPPAGRPKSWPTVLSHKCGFVLHVPYFVLLYFNLTGSREQDYANGRIEHKETRRIRQTQSSCEASYNASRCLCSAPSEAQRTHGSETSREINRTRHKKTSPLQLLAFHFQLQPFFFFFCQYFAQRIKLF